MHRCSQSQNNLFFLHENLYLEKLYLSRPKAAMITPQASAQKWQYILPTNTVLFDCGKTISPKLPSVPPAVFSVPCG